MSWWRKARKQGHNSLDYGCSMWMGDMRPDPADRHNLKLLGGSAALNDRRCLICRPFTEDEADKLLEIEGIEDLTALTHSQ